MTDDLLNLQERLKKGGVLISFSGKLSQAIIEELGEAIKKYLETEDQPKTDIFNIFSIFIEQTQNIKNYCASNRDTDLYEILSASSIVTIGNVPEGGKYVCSGNLIKDADAGHLVRTMSQLVDLDGDALKKMYKQKLKAPLPPGGEAAGMGLIDIARKARRPLDFSVKAMGEGLSFFTLKAIV